MKKISIPKFSYSGREKPLLATSSSSTSPEESYTRKNQTAKEWAAGTTAGCAAVLCCAPLVVAEFIVLVVYKVPSGLCRRVVRKRRMTKKMKTMKDLGLLYVGVPAEDNLYDELIDDETVELVDTYDDEVIDLDKEMWEHFNNGGFWRSPSNKDE